MVDLAPGDVIVLTSPYHDGVKKVLAEKTLLFVVAVFTESVPIKPGGFNRAPERILLMPEGMPRLMDLQQHWVREHCKRLTKWTTQV